MFAYFNENVLHWATYLLRKISHYHYTILRATYVETNVISIFSINGHSRIYSNETTIDMLLLIIKVNLGEKWMKSLAALLPAYEPTILIQ